MSSKLFFSAFLMNTPSHTVHGFWKTPESQNYMMDSLSHWTGLAQDLESLGYDLLMFADTVGLRMPWNGNYEIAVKEGLQFPAGDPMVLMSALAAVTKNLGLVFTSSVIQDPPFDFARKISTLDHLSNGRIGWNIVTSAFENAYKNFGYEALPPHGERYGLAEEYLEVVYKLWEGSWDDGALRRDKQEGIYADPSKIHKIHHEGKFFRVEGPHFVGPSPQRTPFLFQAGASPVGLRFAAKHAEASFISSPSLAAAKNLVDEGRKIAADGFGREATDIKYFQGMSFVIGDTDEEVAAKLAAYRATVNDEAIVAHALGDAGIDAGGYPLDTPLSELGETTGSLGYARWARENSGNDEPTIRDLAGVLEGARIIGTPEQIADQLEQWLDAGVEGVNVYPSVRPGSFRELGEKVFPVLRRRGLMNEDQTGTLRQKVTGHGDLLPTSHTAASYRGAFTGHSMMSQQSVDVP